MISAKKSLLEKKIKLISKNIENVLIELLHETVDAKKARPKTRKSKKVILKKTSASSSLKAKGRPKGGLMEVLIEYASKLPNGISIEELKKKKEFEKINPSTLYQTLRRGVQEKKLVDEQLTSSDGKFKVYKVA